MCVVQRPPLKKTKDARSTGGKSSHAMLLAKIRARHRNMGTVVLCNPKVVVYFHADA